MGKRVFSLNWITIDIDSLGRLLVCEHEPFFCDGEGHVRTRYLAAGFIMLRRTRQKPQADVIFGSSLPSKRCALLSKHVDAFVTANERDRLSLAVL